MHECLSILGRLLPARNLKAVEVALLSGCATCGARLVGDDVPTEIFITQPHADEPSVYCWTCSAEVRQARTPGIGLADLCS